LQKNVEKNYVVEMRQNCCENRVNLYNINSARKKNCMWIDAAAKIMGIYTTLPEVEFF